jgi:hypothetical protein
MKEDTQMERLEFLLGLHRNHQLPTTEAEEPKSFCPSVFSSSVSRFPSRAKEQIENHKISIHSSDNFN